mmetsp:Transcript_25905/g.48650  ORF Transcript_25905/g.48650 Transcript_25905/m.48650 type:complete len:215 (+) Transcript_25905:73-717(+)
MARILLLLLSMASAQDSDESVPRGLSALQQQAALVTGLEAMDADSAVELFAAAIEEGDEEVDGEESSGNQTWGANPYNPYAQAPHMKKYGALPYCQTKIEQSSCRIFSCAKSRGPSDCNTKDYTCYCKPGYCSDGTGCIALTPQAPVPGFDVYKPAWSAVPHCESKIEASSCTIFNCASSRGPASCNTTDYYCHCQPGFCSDGKGCLPYYHFLR